MSYLLDTHALVWWLEGDERFPVTLRDNLISRQPQIFISTVSLWEISIKRSLGKWVTLSLPTPAIWEAALSQGLRVLTISPKDLTQLELLPFHHRDPFDRMLIAQAQTHGLSIISRDTHVRAYDVPVRWG